MTSVKCQRCRNWWSVSTLWPEQFHVITRFCPNCVEVVFPRMGEAPLGRSA